MYSIWLTGYFKCLIPVNSMKLPGDPWNNRWSSFYGIAWNFSMEFHRKCPNPPWKMSMQKLPWNSMEIGALMFSMEFHGKCPNPPCKDFPWKSMEKFPWNSMEIDVLILHGIPWRIFHGIPWRFFTWDVLQLVEKVAWARYLNETLSTVMQKQIKFKLLLIS